jgi:cytochrome d ubiquinol oxidase subunit II
MRAQIDQSIGPVWEANHVWLIYVLVFMWTAFPTAFATMITTLFVPWLFVGLGIVLRGAGFAFRKFAATLGQARVFGATFAASSLITPFFLGMIAGGIASGRVPDDGGGLWSSWTGPTSWVGGVLAVLTCSFLAATFLAADAARAGREVLAGECGRRALVSGALSGAVALVAIVPIETDADHLAGGLQGRAAPFVILSAIAGIFALARLRAGRYARARVGAVVAVASVVIGWGVAQYPDLLVDHVEIADAAGARPTLIGLVVVFAIAAVTAVPAMVWLFVLVNRTEWSGTDSAPH